MSTTGLVMTVTDELLAEIEWSAKNTCSYGKDDWFKPDDLRHDIGSDDAKYVAASSPFVIMALTAELRRLRAENAELVRVVKDVRWRVADTNDQLQAYGHNGDRLYGLDEWSVPIRNLNIAIGMLRRPPNNVRRLRAIRQRSTSVPSQAQNARRGARGSC